MDLFSDFILRLSIGLVLVVALSVILHYLVVKFNFKGPSFDNPTSIAIVLSILYIILSYLPKFNLIFFIITNTFVPMALVKEFYKVSWKIAFKFWLVWAGIMISLTSIFAILVIIIF